jgi:hypothetical protein
MNTIIRLMDSIYFREYNPPFGAEYGVRLRNFAQLTITTMRRSLMNRISITLIILFSFGGGFSRLNGQEPKQPGRVYRAPIVLRDHPKTPEQVLALRPKIQSRLKGTTLKYAPAQIALTGETMPCSTGIVAQGVGTAPEGWSNGFEWCREQGQVLLVIFVNTAYEPGIPISGLKAGDWFYVTGAARLSATFSEDTGNQTAMGITKVVATGADILAASLGQAELAPLISAGESFTEDQFKGSGKGTKRRDAYGRDPASGVYHLAEGGVVVALPPADPAIAYSGDGDHTNRWLKKHEPRFDQNKPDHLSSPNYFFPVPDSEYVSNNVRQVQSDGTAWIMPWDSYFPDNAGSYAVYVLLSQTKPNLPDLLHLQ